MQDMRFIARTTGRLYDPFPSSPTFFSALGNFACPLGVRECVVIYESASKRARTDRSDAALGKDHVSRSTCFFGPAAGQVFRTESDVHISLAAYSGGVL
jgi:hypothetical protein